MNTEYDTSAGRVIIRVRDDGAGIPEDILQKVQDPFFTTRREEGGTGLGLYISSTIIADHGGTLTLESVGGKGTMATIVLPV